MSHSQSKLASAVINKSEEFTLTTGPLAVMSGLLNDLQFDLSTLEGRLSLCLSSPVECNDDTSLYGSTVVPASELVGRLDDLCSRISSACHRVRELTSRVTL